MYMYVVSTAAAVPRGHTLDAGEARHLSGDRAGEGLPRLPAHVAAPNQGIRPLHGTHEGQK